MSEQTVGDVVQIDPAHDLRFGGCFMVITEVRNWGYIGYFSIPGETGLAYYRVRFDDCHPIGKAEWAVLEESEVRK